MTGGKILVTGAGGFIGRHLVAACERARIDVVALTRTAGSKTDDRPSLMLDLTKRRSLAPLVDALNGCDVAVFLAAHVPLRGRTDSFDATCTIDRLSAEALIRSRCPRAVYVSGISVLGFDVASVDEHSPPRPTDGYTRAKAAGEAKFIEAGRQTGRRVSVLRLNAPYGPGMPDHAVVSTFLTAAASGRPITIAGNGRRFQQFTWIEDCARAVLAVAESDGGIFHFCGPNRVTMLTLAEMCRDAVGSASEIIVDHELDAGLSCPEIAPDRLEGLWPRRRRTPLNEGLMRFTSYFTERSIKDMPAIVEPN